MSQATRSHETTLRQAAFVAGFSLLVMAVLAPCAFFYIFPKLVVRTDIVQTIQNITAHLGMLAYLVYRSGYIPRLLGVLLAINSAGYLVDTLRPYLFPETTVPYLFVAFFGELIFMSWLFFRGSGLQDPPSAGAV